MYYEVFYHRRDGISVLKSLQVASPQKSAVLENLMMYTFYAIRVQAFTVESGNFSSSIFVRTLQDGKLTTNSQI